jgi:hypothetical protein
MALSTMIEKSICCIVAKELHRFLTAPRRAVRKYHDTLYRIVDCPVRHWLHFDAGGNACRVCAAERRAATTPQDEPLSQV